jgi:hypothetical protein
MMARPMRIHRFTATEFATALAAPEAADALSDPGGSVVVVAIDDRSSPDAAPAPIALATLPAVVVGTSATDMPREADLVDVVVPPDGDELDATVDAVAANPLAATALALVLRGSEARSVSEGLQLESAVYGTLQGGPEFAAWRTSSPVHPPRPEAGPTMACSVRPNVLWPPNHKFVTVTASVTVSDALWTRGIYPDVSDEQ